MSIDKDWVNFAAFCERIVDKDNPSIRYPATQTPAPNTIPVSNSSGILEAGWLDGSGLDVDKVDGFHASITPAPNVIVPLDAEGILDLSATYVRSNVYTFRRVDLTNASSDYFLQVGEVAKISFFNATSVPLHIATQSGTIYEMIVNCTNTGGTSGGSGFIFLNPNNTTYSNAFIYAEIVRSSNGLGGNYYTYSAFRVGQVFSFGWCLIQNYTQIKSIAGEYNLWGGTYDYPTAIAFTTNWRDTTTVWASLGTVTFGAPTNGEIYIRRIR